MNKIIKRFFSILLVLAFVINLLPLNVLASKASCADALREILATKTPSIVTDEDDSMVAPPTYIQEIPVEVVEENLSRRSKYYKEFVLNNGLRLAAIYPDAIHYEEDGLWKEIDNTLTAKVINGQSVYANSAGLWDVRFPQRLTSSNAISITKDGYTISFGMAGEIHTSGDLAVASSNFQTEANSASTLTAQIAMSSTAQIQELDIASIKDAAEFEETVPDKLYSKLLYPNVYPGTNIVYNLSSNQLKESIIIPRYDATLWGYRYELDTGGLIPVLNGDQSINLQDPITSDIVMTMPAPFVLDADEAYCENVTVSLVQKGDIYLLSYHLPHQWLEEEARAWPVILDPIVSANNEQTNIQDVTVASNSTESNNAPTIKCGYHLSHGIFRTYLRYKTLPTLCSADMIHSATIQLTKPYDSDLSAPIEVHKVNAPWEARETSWSNKAAFNSTIEDITIVQDPAQYSWDVTDIVYGWYADTSNALQNNTGMMFKASNEIETGGTKNWQQFCSSDFGSGRPVLTIEFQETNGIEDYWDYTSSSAGRAGTGYVQNHSGNLVWVHSDIGFDGNRMPVSISHIYNTHDASSNPFGMGNGWRTNFNQTIALVNGSYVWKDGDGTQHHFIPTSTASKFKDADGLELTLTVATSGYTITDKYDNTSQFNTNGYLIKQTNNQGSNLSNENNKASTITIEYEGSSARIIKIEDGAKRNYYFTYNSNNLLNQIIYYGTKGPGTGPAIMSINFAYSANANLTSITYKDGKTSTFSYTSKNLLSTATDIDDYKISYGYNTLASGKPSRVVSITELHNNSTGMSTTINYALRQTALTDHENNTKVLFFNEWGNAISSSDIEGRSTLTEYATDRAPNAKKNQVLMSSQIQNTIVNLILDSNFENGTAWTADSNAANCQNVTEASGLDSAYYGSRSIQSACANAHGVYGASYGTFAVAAGESYSFSAYIKTEASSYVKLRISDGAGIVAESSILDPNSYWTRLEATYTNISTSTRNVTLSLYHVTPGVAYLDCVQFEKSENASSYNFVDNGDFCSNGSGWTLNGSTSSLYVGHGGHAPILSAGRFVMLGDPDEVYSISQTVQVNGGEGDTLILGGWAYGNALAAKNNRVFGLKLTFNYTNGSQGHFTVPFHTDLSSNNVWQYAVVAAKAAWSYYSVTVHAEYGNNGNYVAFDGIQLTKEGFGESYTYDENGNITSVTDILKNVTIYSYDTNNDLITTSLPTKTKTTNVYDNRHNVIKSTKSVMNGTIAWEDIVSHEYSYNEYGNVIETSSTAGGVKKTTTAKYGSNGNHLEFTTDTAGKKTLYGYDLETSTLRWVQYPEGSSTTRTNYEYDNMFRLVKTTALTDIGNDLSAQYTYDGDSLTAITTPSTTYSLAYGDFALRTGVSIGSRTLATYSYTEDLNHHLEKLDYGNGDKIQYTYDKLGRVTQETYTDGGSATPNRTITYKYDNTGALTTVKDSKTGITTRYYYDTVGRLTKQQEDSQYHVRSLRYQYDGLGNVAECKEFVDSELYTTQFCYDNENRPSVVISGDAAESYEYDDFGRLQTVTTYHDFDDLMHRTLTYGTRGGNTTTDQVASLSYDFSADIDYAFIYTYDGNGNITAIQKGDTTTSYVYDSANQLIRENNEEAGKTWVWTYDEAGNITSKKEYTYTTGTLGTAADTITYSYGNSAWGDLLTAYDGISISYDAIGNPISDANWSYTWSQGRQLSSMYRASVTWNFTYDANGMRTGRSYGSTAYTYVYSGSQLSYMTCGNNTMKFTYGADGSPLAISYNGTIYYYVVNLQGDVVAILDSTGAQVVGYTYDAWGRLLSTTGSKASSLGWHNPLRYRGYVYDEEIGLYYLQSRYYSPKTGRFLNADGYISTGQGVIGNNMFVYCLNNPVNGWDPCGTCWHNLWLSDCASCQDNANDTLALVFSTGRYGSITIGAFSITATAEIGFDTKGNVQINSSFGFDVTTSGSLSASIGKTTSAYVMPDTSYLAGDSYYAGGSATVPVPGAPVSVTGSGNIIQTSDGYWGGAVSTGIAPPNSAGVEAHGGMSHTHAWTSQINIFEEIGSFFRGLFGGD